MLLFIENLGRHHHEMPFHVTCEPPLTIFSGTILPYISPTVLYCGYLCIGFMFPKSLSDVRFWILSSLKTGILFNVPLVN